MNDPIGNFQMFCWVNDNIVKIVFNVHMGAKDESFMTPRIIEYNRKHISLVLGDYHVITVKIPQIINNYNHWMLGVNLVDQLIAFYQPKIRCQRTWMPLFLHGADIIHFYSYV